MSDATRRNGVFGSSGSPGAAEGFRKRATHEVGAKNPSCADASAGMPEEGKGADGRGVKRQPERGLRECRAKMLQLLAMRDYSTAKMREKLAGAGFAADDCAAVIEAAVAARLMDDRRFGVNYISFKQQAGWGRQKIERGLSAQGIDCGQLPGYPDAFFLEDDELQRAVACLRKHRTAAKNAREAHYRHLLSKGFAPAVCRRALAMVVEHDDEAI